MYNTIFLVQHMSFHTFTNYFIKAIIILFPLLCLVATVITDGRYGTGTTEIFLTNPYCRSEYNNIKYCTLSSSGSQCSPLTCSYNRIGLKCYGNFKYYHHLLSLNNSSALPNLSIYSTDT